MARLSRKVADLEPCFARSRAETAGAARRHQPKRTTATEHAVAMNAPPTEMDDRKTSSGGAISEPTRAAGEDARGEARWVSEKRWKPS